MHIRSFLHKNYVEIFLLLISVVLVYKVDFSTDFDAEFYFKKEDIYYEYEAAKQVQSGENPYSRILEGNMLENDKYATQLPLYFYILAQIREWSGNNFSGFVENFRQILFYAQIVGGLGIYWTFRGIGQKAVGYFGALFYVFNVWTLNSFIYLKQDILAIAFLVWAFYWFRSEQNRWLGYLFFGLSLGIKHIGIFAAPLFVTPLLFKQDTPKKFLLNLAVLGAAILIPTLPFLIEQPESFTRSMLFSLTRQPSESDILYGYNELLVQYNAGFDTGTLTQQLLPRLPLLLASLTAVYLLFTKKIKPSMYALVAIFVFTVFNPVIYPQYITWIPPLTFIAFSDYMRNSKLT